jgi:hypothetical protein
MLVRPYMYIVMYICCHYLISHVKVYYIRTTSSFLCIIVFIFFSQTYDFIIFLRNKLKKIDTSTNRIGGVVSEWLLFNANSATFQLYDGEKKLIFNEMMMRSTLY